jgi:5'(3')-deoxyribonucleotidase
MITFREFKKLNKKEITIFCDMDGVLTDFLGGIARHLGKKSFEQGDIDKVLLTDAGTSKGWWLALDPLPDQKTLWKYISQYNIQILSACPSVCRNDKAVMAGKKAWIKKHCKPSPSQVNIVQRREKKNFADSNHILIDDHIRNTKDFEFAGGHGIVHTSAIKTIKQLKGMVRG